MHMLKPEVADKLTELLTPMEGKRILEIGTGWAESAEFFSRLKPAWKIYTRRFISDTVGAADRSAVYRWRPQL
jgi:protein-L-isoaspartate O-methyltransferase